MLGYVYVCHGSPLPAINQQAQLFMEELIKQRSAQVFQAFAYLENHSRTIISASQEAFQVGVDQLVLVPLLLFEGKHTLVDLPTVQKHLMVQYPLKQIKLAEPFGDGEACEKLLLRRFKQSLTLPSIDRKNVQGVLLAHGTKRSSVPAEKLTEIALRLSKQLSIPIKAASIKGNDNGFSLLKETLTTNQQTVIVPFFLSNGRLYQAIADYLLSLNGDYKYVLTDSLQFDQTLIDDIMDKVEQVCCENRLP